MSLVSRLGLFGLVVLVACQESDDKVKNSGGKDDCVPPQTVDADEDGVAVGEDCDDQNAAVKPGADELCNGVDDDCDGGVDDGAVGAAAG